MEMCSSPAIAEDGTILVGCRDRHLYAVSAAGAAKWKFKTGGWVDASPAIGADGTIYFGSWDGKFYALTAAGGKKWEFATGGPIMSSAAIDLQGTIYFGAHDGRLYALNPDGAKRWEFLTRGRIISSPAIAGNGDIIFTSLDGKLYAVDRDGKLRWSLHTKGITASSPVIAADGTIYLGVNQAHCAVSAEGKLKWAGDMSPTGYVPWDWVRATPVAVGNGHVVVAGTDLSLMLLKPDGDWIWTFSMETGSYSSPAIGLDGTIYAAALGGKLFAMKNPLPLAASSWPMFRGNPQHTGRARAVP
jgi:outer membrane protein assembly factor BamB